VVEDGDGTVDVVIGTMGDFWHDWENDSEEDDDGVSEITSKPSNETKEEQKMETRKVDTEQHEEKRWPVE